MTPRATARRNVSERIDRFLNGLEGVRRLPNRRELFWLREALVDLQEGQYSAGEDAMDKAERMLPVPEHTANDPSTNAGVTIEQLRAQLDQIMKAEGRQAGNFGMLTSPATDGRSVSACPKGGARTGPFWRRWPTCKSRADLGPAANALLRSVGKGEARREFHHPHSKT
jgi:hypothetical protein